MPITDKRESKVKLWIGMPNNNKNQTWYNFLSVNKQSNEKIIQDMSNRILQARLKFQFVKAIFFDNETGEELRTLQGNAYK